jgi:hypothetical protein
MAFYSWSFVGMAPFGNLIAGAVAHHWGPLFAVWCSGMVMLIAAGFFLAGLGRFRKLARPIYQARGLPLGETADLFGREEIAPPPAETKESDENDAS